MYLLIVSAIIVGFITVVYYTLTKRAVCIGKRAGNIRAPIQRILQKDQLDLIKYELTDFESPKVTGIIFKFLVRASYSLLGRPVLVPLIIKKSNLDLLGGEYIPELPTLYPSLQCSYQLENKCHKNKQILQNISDKYVISSDKFHHVTSLDYYQSYRHGNCTPLDVADSVLKAIETSNQNSPPLQAIIDTNNEMTLKMAEASARRWKEGAPLSLLDGVPFAVKCEFKLDYLAKSLYCGSTFMCSSTNNCEEPILINRLLDAGAVLIGLTNMQEFGTGVIGSNPHTGYLTARNPYNTSCYTGGSSSGSASSISSGLCPLTIGGDAGGSIRIPAALCGVFGFKPTFGYINKSGSPSFVYSVGVLGPLGASTIDLAISMNIMSDYTIDLQDLNRSDFSGIKLGIYHQYFEHSSPEIVKCCKKAVDVMVSCGAQVIDIVIPELEEMKVAHFVTASSEFSNSFAVDVDNKFEEFNEETLMLLAGGLTRSAVEYINSQKQRTRAIAILRNIFEEVDVIVTPMTACVAPVIPNGSTKYGYGDAQLTGRLTRYSFISNLTGIPSVTVPVGFSDNGLPIGIQLQTHWNKDGFLLSLSYLLEKCLLNNSLKPRVYFDIINK